MSEFYKGDYSPDMFNEQKRYFQFQAQEKTNLTDAELRDLHSISNTNLRRIIQGELGDSAIRDGFKIKEHPSDNTNNFAVTGGDGSLDNPGVLFLKGYRLSLRNDIGYSDQGIWGSITDDFYTKTVLPQLTTPTGSNFNFTGVTSSPGATIVVGSDATYVLKSSDSGRNFFDKPCTANLNFVTPTSDASTFYAAGDTFFYPVLMKSVDAGNSWANLCSTTDLNASDITQGSFYGVSFINSGIGYVVGTNGFIFRTVNSGGNWFQQLSGITNTLRSINAFDNTHVWAVGDAGTILYSPNTLSWVLQPAPVGTNLTSVQAVNQTTAFACGDIGVILKTSNTGSSWITCNSDSSQDFNSIFFLNSSLGWAVGNGGIITRTLDGGFTWDSTIVNSGYDFNAVYFKDTTGFIAAGNGTNGLILRTLDGTKWEPYRNDYVYVDFHLAEVSGDATSGSEYTDSTLIDSLVGLPSANRLRIVQDIKVSEGWPTPPDYTSSDSTSVVQHYTYTLATIQRYPNKAVISDADISDSRAIVKTVSELDYTLKHGGVDSSSLASGSVTPDKINVTADFTVGSLQVFRDATIMGDVRIEGILHVEDQRESVITDSLLVKGSTILGDSSNDSLTVYGPIAQILDSSAPAYNLHALPTSLNAPLFNILQDGSGTVLKISKTVDSFCPILDVTSVGLGYDLKISHSGNTGGILKSYDDSTNNSFHIQKDATRSTASVFDITTNSYGPAISIHNTALCDSKSIKIDQSSGNGIIINAMGDASSIVINSYSTGTDLKINHIGSSGFVFDVTSSGSGLLKAQNNEGEAFNIKQSANSNVFTINKDSTGSGRVIEINSSSIDPSIQINTLGTGIGLHVSHTGDSSSPAVDVFVAGNETGPAIRITKANNDSTNDVGQAILVTNHGFSESLKILHDNTDSTASLLSIANLGQGYDASAINWTIDRYGNFRTNGDYTGSVFAFDSSFYLSGERFFLDTSNFDSSNPGIAGSVFQDGGFLRISDGTTQLDPVGGFGKTGLQGLTGLFGAPGVTGLALGVTGLRGPTGLVGQTGIIGPMGSQGITGFLGVDGVTGIQGFPGYTGVQGLTGILGINGATGTQGATGLGGQTGIQGITGLYGQTGLQGATGGVGILSASQLPLGNPPGGFSNGIFPWNSNTMTNPALDEVNALLLAISPTPPGPLTGGLVLSNTVKYSAILPTGLNSSWYQNGQVAGSTITDYVVDGTYNLTNPNTATTFKVGSTFGGDDGTVVHVLDGTNSSSRPISAGVGVTGDIELLDVSTYNSIWRKGNARIDYAHSVDGFKRHAMLYHSSIGDQSTSDTYVWYDDVDGIPGFPIDATVAQSSVSSARFLSGIKYYYTGDTFSVSSQVSNIAKKSIRPVNPVSYIMPGLSQVNVAIPGSSIAWDGTYNLSAINALNISNVYTTDAKLTVTATKPSGVSSNKTTNSQNRLVNTYSPTYSTNGSIYMVDESYRWRLSNDFSVIPANPTNPTGDWTSVANLVNGNAQLYSTTWYYPSINFTSNYLPIQSANYSGFSGDQVAVWAAYVGTGHSSMIVVFTGINYTDISPDGSGNLNFDVRLPNETVWLDCGRSFGDGSGCRNDLGSSGGTLAITFGTHTSTNSSGVVFLRATLKSPSAAKASAMMVTGT